MGFGRDLVKSADVEADANFFGLGLGGQEAVVKTATVADALELMVKTEHWDDDNIKLYRGAVLLVAKRKRFPFIIELFRGKKLEIWVIDLEPGDETGDVDFPKALDRLKKVQRTYLRPIDDSLQAVRDSHAFSRAFLG